MEELRTNEFKIKREALIEFKKLAREELPKVESNWKLIWAFSGPHGFHQQGTYVKKGPDAHFQNIGNEVNEARTRFVTACKIAREVTALNSGKEVRDITLEDIRTFGPKIFYNEWDWQNDDLRQLFFKEDGESQFGFPRENLIIPPNSQIMHTGHQFERFPQELLNSLAPEDRFVLVSDLYHLPRILRHAWKWFRPEIIEKIILYPSQPLVGSFRLFRGELNKIFQYGAKGDLSWETPKKIN